MYVMYIYVLKNQYYQNNYRPKEMIYNENFRVKNIQNFTCESNSFKIRSFSSSDSSEVCKLETRVNFGPQDTNI